MPTTRIRFTDAKVRDLLRDAEGAPGRVEYQDDVNPYLYARVSAGRLAWSAVVWSPQQRKTVRHPLGTHVEMNVKAARDAAAIAVADIKGGIDRAKERKAKRAAADRGRQTISEMFHAYVKQCADEGQPLAAASIRSYKLALPALLGEFFDSSIDALDAAKLKELIIERSRKRTVTNKRTGTKREVGSANGARIACDILSRLCKVNNVADPSQELRVNWRGFPKHGARDGRLGESDAQNLFAWLHDFQANGKRGDHVTRQARMMMLALVTGWRALTIASLRWEFIKWNAGVIEFPAEVMKNKKPFTVPLYGAVADLLRPHKKAHGLIFAKANGKPAEFTDDFLATLPYECSPHDARKIVALILSTREGVMPVVTKLLLSHAGTRGDVTFTHYLATTPLPDRLRHMRVGTDALDAFYRAKVGDKKTIIALDRLAEPRRVATAERYNNHSKAAHKRRRDKQRALREAMAA